jgi:hypothetical protein
MSTNGDTDRTADSGTGAPQRARSAAGTWAFAAGALAGLIPFLLLLSAGSSSLVQWFPAGNLYDDQARSILDGRLDVSPHVSGIESFANEGRSYLYFGPFPALLRLPVVAATDDFEGRLGQASLLLAWFAIVAAATLAFREIRFLTAGHAGWRRGEVGLAVLLGFLVGGGSIVTYLAFRPVIYSEAIAWGVAGALASAAALLRYGTTFAFRWLAAASALAVVGLATRVTVGVGAALAVLVIALLASTLRGSRILDLPRPLPIAPALVVAILPFAVFSGIQFAKFDSLEVRPSQHVGTALSPGFPPYAEANGDHFFSPAFVPTNALSMLVWPSAVGLSSQFPWLDPSVGKTPPLVGEPVMGRSWTGSLLGTQTFFVALAVPGLIAVFGRRRPRSDTSEAPGSLNVLRTLVLCGMAAFLVTLAYGFPAHRFLADALPPLVLLAAVGAVRIGRWRPGRSWWKPVVLTALLVAALWTTWINLAVGFLHQTELGWAAPRAALEHLYALRELTGTELEATQVSLLGTLPENPQSGDLAIVGDCEGLFAAAGGVFGAVLWHPVERGPAFERQVTVDGRLLPAGTSLLISGAGAERPRLTLEKQRGRLELAYEGVDGSRQAYPLDPQDRVHVTYDPATRSLTVDKGAFPLLSVSWLAPLTPTWGDARSENAVRAEPQRQPDLCRKVATGG